MGMSLEMEKQGSSRRVRFAGKLQEEFSATSSPQESSQPHVLEKRDQASLTTSPSAWLFICWAALSEPSGPTGRDRLSGQCGPEAYSLRGASLRKQGVWARRAGRSLLSCLWRQPGAGRPAMMSDGTMSRSRKNSAKR